MKYYVGVCVPRATDGDAFVTFTSVMEKYRFALYFKYRSRSIKTRIRPYVIRDVTNGRISGIIRAKTSGQYILKKKIIDKYL